MASFLITGSGMLAGALLRTLQLHGHTPTVLPHTELDICNRDEVKRLIGHYRPEVIFHTAALTRVNYCEEHPDEARRVNALGTRQLVEAADQAMARVIYFSTDYVFDGEQSWPYQEDSLPYPLNQYGASKLAGENAVKAYFRGHVVRTSGIFGERADGLRERNFFAAIIEQLVSGQTPLSVVEDQTTAVTYAPHLARMVLGLLDEGLPKLIHLTSSGSDSWLGWARVAAQALGEDPALLVGVPFQAEAAAVRRPRYSVLGSMLAQARSAMAMHPARPAVEAYAKEAALRMVM